MRHTIRKPLSIIGSIILLNGCGGGNGESDLLGAEEEYYGGEYEEINYSYESLYNLQHFASASTQVPAVNKPLTQATSPELMRAIELQVFETEFDSGNSAPHYAAWSSMNLHNYSEGSPYRKTYSCQEYAADASYYEPSSGQGTYTVVSELTADFTGSVEIEFDDCVINGKARTGSRKVTVLESSAEHGYYSGDPSPHFRLEFSDYYWGDKALTHYLNGSVTYREEPGASYQKPYSSLSNFTLLQKNKPSIEARAISTRCSEDSANYELGWRCEIASGEIALGGFGSYSVRSVSPNYGSLWSNNSKIDFSDSNDNRFVYWANGTEKKMTWVTPNNHESTFVVAYNSDIFEPVGNDSNLSTAELETRVLATEFEAWENKSYAYMSDEFILFKEPGASTVDAIRSTTQQRRSIDLVDAAYDVSVNVIGDMLHSGHDGAVRSVALADPQLISHKTEIGLGKIVEVYGDQVVGYTTPGEDQRFINRIHYTWDSTNNRILDTTSVDYGADAFISRSGQNAETSSSGVYFRLNVSESYNSRHVATGENYDYLKFFKHELMLTGGGVLIKCQNSCAEDAVYWKSLNEAIQAKYPTAGQQIFVAGATDTEFNSGAASLMIFATLPLTAVGDYYYDGAPGYGTKLWAVDLNDTRRITELRLPFNPATTPAVRFDIHHLSKANNGDMFVGSGSWNLDSGRDNTVFFNIDPAKISFD